jgi:hypothetical protein
MLVVPAEMTGIVASLAGMVELARSAAAPGGGPAAPVASGPWQRPPEPR